MAPASGTIAPPAHLPLGEGCLVRGLRFRNLADESFSCHSKSPTALSWPAKCMPAPAPTAAGEAGNDDSRRNGGIEQAGAGMDAGSAHSELGRPPALAERFGMGELNRPAPGWM
jgi:hypothetical protein